MNLSTLPITLRQLQYLCAVERERSFRKAAECCHVSQPALSTQVAEAERALGIQFFERDRRGVRITRAGSELIGYARAVLVATEDLLDATTRHNDPLTGMLRIGIIPTMAPYLLPEIDPALREAFPKLELQWTEARTETLVASIREGELDAAVMALEADIGGLEHETIGEDPFLVATPAGHALAEEGTVKLKELRAHPMLLLDDGHCFREQTLEVCSRSGTKELGFRATSLSTLVQMIAGGGGATLLPRMAVDVENRRAQLVLRAFEDPSPKRTVILAWRGTSPLGEELKQLAAVARHAFERAAA